MMEDYTTAQIGEPDLQQQSPFFTRLPAEIRLEIYEHLTEAPQHVEKSWDSVRRRTHLTRRLQEQESDKSSLPTSQQQKSSSSAPGLSLLLACRRTYLEAATSIQPRSLVFTDLDTLSAYLLWPKLKHTRHRVRELECSWHAEGPGANSIVPAWKAERWATCCEAMKATGSLPRIQRIRACIFSSSGRYHAKEKTVEGLTRWAEDRRGVQVCVDVVTKAAGMDDIRFMTGRNFAKFLSFGRGEDERCKM